MSGGVITDKTSERALYQCVCIRNSDPTVVRQQLLPMYPGSDISVAPLPTYRYVAGNEGRERERGGRASRGAEKHDSANE